MKFKFNKSTVAIYAIVFVVYIGLMILLWQEKDFGFWCFLVSSIIIWANMLFIYGYTYGGNKKQAVIMDQALYVIPVVTYIVICISAWKLTKLVEYRTNHYLAILIAIFALSFILQISMFSARKSNITQEENIASGRWDRDELVYQWKKITGIALDKGYIEINKIADKLHNDIKYSDPVSNKLLTGIDKDIIKYTQEVLSMLGENDVDMNGVISKIKEVSVLFEERADKCKRLKGNS